MARRGRPRKQTQSPRKYFIVFFFLIIAALVLFTGVRIVIRLPRLSLFSVSRIDTAAPLPERLEKDIIGLIEGQSLFSLDLHPVREQIMARHPEIKDIRIIKKLPSSLFVEVEERVPFLQLKDGAYFLLGRDFVVIDKQMSPFPGMIEVETQDLGAGLKPGDIVDRGPVSAAAELIEVLSRFDDLAPEIVLAHDPESLSFYTHGVNIILGEGEFERKLNLLRSLLKENFDNDFSRVRYVDLRYSKVYIGKRK